MTTITAAMLRKQYACNSQVVIFKKEWPNGATLSKENLLRAAELDLNLAWHAKHFLPPPLWTEYQRLGRWNKGRGHESCHLAQSE